MSPLDSMKHPDALRAVAKAAARQAADTIKHLRALVAACRATGFHSHECVAAEGYLAAFDESVVVARTDARREALEESSGESDSRPETGGGA